MAGATPYIQPEEIYPQPGLGSYHGSLGLHGMGMASPYVGVPQGGYIGSPYIESGHIGSRFYDEYEDGYAPYGRSPYHRSRRMSSASRYYPDHDDYHRYDRSPSSNRYYDRYYDQDRYDRRDRYGRDYDRRYYDGYSSRHYSSGGHRGPNGETLMYRRTSKGDVQVLRNGRESIGDKVRRTLGLDPKGVNVVRLKPGESLVGGRHY